MRYLIAAILCLISVTIVSQSQCESVSIPGFHVNPFDVNEIHLLSLNESETEFYSYPGWRLYDDVGSLIAEEDVNFFGIMGYSLHTLNLPFPLDYNVSSFDATLELWTGFYENMECVFDLEIFPWKVDESMDDPYGCVPIQLSFQGSSTENTSIDVVIKDENELTLLEETFVWEAGTFGGIVGSICLDQGACYYLTIEENDTIQDLYYTISNVLDLSTFWSFYLYEEFDGQDIILNPYGQGDCSSNGTINLGAPDYGRTQVKVLDALGREINHANNQILFHIYDDGSVEKKFVLE